MTGTLLLGPVRDKDTAPILEPGFELGKQEPQSPAHLEVGDASRFGPVDDRRRREAQELGDLAGGEEAFGHLSTCTLTPALSPDGAANTRGREVLSRRVDCRSPNISRVPPAEAATTRTASVDGEVRATPAPRRTGARVALYSSLLFLLALARGCLPVQSRHVSYVHGAMARLYFGVLEFLVFMRV